MSKRIENFIRKELENLKLPEKITEKPPEQHLMHKYCH